MMHDAGSFGLFFLIRSSRVVFAPRQIRATGVVAGSRPTWCAGRLGHSDNQYNTLGVSYIRVCSYRPTNNTGVLAPNYLNKLLRPSHLHVSKRQPLSQPILRYINLTTEDYNEPSCLPPNNCVQAGYRNVPSLPVSKSCTANWASRLTSMIKS